MPRNLEVGRLVWLYVTCSLFFKKGSTGAEVSNERRRPVIVRPFYGDGHSHEYGATQANVEEGQDQVLDILVV